MSVLVRAPAAAELAFCTIISKNYVSQARSLAESLESLHPEAVLHVLLVDRVDGYFDPACEPFQITVLEELAIPKLPQFCFQYNVVELNTAAKPYFLAHLLAKYGMRKLVYFDPDILVLRRLDRLSAILDCNNLVLTPHLTHPYPLDGKGLDELAILMAGTYNLGFLGIANTTEVKRFLSWWQERLYRGCQHNSKAGMFFDQRWMDLTPGYFAKVRVLRDPGYNIASWNLHARRIAIDGPEVLVNDQPAYFMHFSGYDPNRPLCISKNQNRLDMKDLGDGRVLFTRYRLCLLRHGYKESIGWPYVFGTFDNGYRIPDPARRLYRQMGNAADGFGNPFLADGQASFFHWLTRTTDSEIAPLLLSLYHQHVELGRMFPDVHGAHRLPFLDWARVRCHWVCEQLGAEPKLVELIWREVEPAKPRLETKLFERAGRGPYNRPLGVNLAGYLESEKGTGEAARCVIRALEAVGIPYALSPLRDASAQNRDGRYLTASPSRPYAFNLIQANADMCPEHLRDQANLADYYNIGYWNWELSRFPAMWDGSFRFFDEIWAPLTFTQKAIASRSPVPVYYVPYSVSVPAQVPPGIGRAYFGLPAEPFFFLFTFDCHSFLARKNPLAVIQAFQLAFGNRADVLLVLKAMHGDLESEPYRRLAEACRGRPNVRLVNDVYSRSEALALVQLCDAYVSLHRSEGFGLTIAEAMALGKPVIATAYSSSLDFMSIGNSCPVRAQLTTLTEDHGPYQRGQVWAEPDLDHAAWYMRRLVAEKGLAERIGARARQDIASQLAPARVGTLLYARLVSAGVARETAGQAKRAA